MASANISSGAHPGVPTATNANPTPNSHRTNAHNWSERHKIPTIQHYLANKDREHQDNYDNSLTPDELSAAKRRDEGRDPGDDREELRRNMRAHQGRTSDSTDTLRGERTVKDPTTGFAVKIKDSDLDNHSRPSEDVSYDHLGKHYDETPVQPQARNLSLQPFPPAPSASVTKTITNLHRLTYFSIATTFVLWILTAFSSGWIAFIFRSWAIGLVGFGASYFSWAASRKFEREMERVRLDVHRRRAEKHSPSMPESVEWLNSLLTTFWGLMDPEMFLSIADMVEDIMQQSLPAVVDAVRISDMGQGTNPFRIISMRSLPDKATDKRNKGDGHHEQDHTGVQAATQEEEDLDESGEYVNMEVAFAYSAESGKEANTRTKNIHLLLEFFLGVFDWVHIPVPLWVQIEGIVGTVRLRLQFIPVFPFVRNVTFTFMGVPDVDVSVIPMTKALPNVLDLPLVSNFVKMAIAAGTAEFVAPKSMTLNLQEMLSGAAIGDTRAIGVFLVCIHYGEDLGAQDENGSSDPYIVLAYSKFGKPLYSTRIISKDLNPVFEETCALLVTADEIKAEENLSVMLWDSDEHTSDDVIGRIKVPVKDLMKEPNRMHRRSDQLEGFEDDKPAQGKLHWSVGFYEKAPLNKELEIPEDHPTAMPTKSLPEQEMRFAPNPAAKDGPPSLPDPTRTPPDPRWKSGVLSVVIHQINQLEKQNLKGTTSKEREGVAGQDTDEFSEQTGNLPSAFCEVIVNDDMVYKTRVKQYSNTPYFEAGTEQFVRNWQDTVVRIVVRNSSLREKDPILGIVNLHLKDLFNESSEVTRLFALEEGIGFGRISASLLFKPLKMDLPHNMLGWETGTIELSAPVVLELDSQYQELASKFKKLVISTTDSTEKLSKKEAEIRGSRIEYDIDLLRLPCYSRFSSVLTFELEGSAATGLFGSDAKALSMLWLQELVDDETRQIKIPIMVSKNIEQLRQNYINQFTQQTHDYQIVGWLSTTIKLDAGLDEDHESHSVSQARRHAFETYDHVEGQAQLAEKNAHADDDGVIDKEEAKAIKRADKRQQWNRQRGIAGFRPYRTAVWMKQGIKDHLHLNKSVAKREPMVQSEGTA